MLIRFCGLVAALVLLWEGKVYAQERSFEDVISSAQNAVGDMAKYQQALQNPDPRFQYALIQEMLKLPDPALQRIAKEHALFSTNPVMREAAIKAILDSGATLRLQLAGTGEKYEQVPKWLMADGGSFVERRGEILIKSPEAVSDACWGNANHCVFRQVGTTLQYNPYYPGNYVNQINSVMTLGDDGVLRGTLSHIKAETVQVQIDLKQ